MSSDPQIAPIQRTVRFASGVTVHAWIIENAFQDRYGGVKNTFRHAAAASGIVFKQESPWLEILDLTWFRYLMYQILGSDSLRPTS